MLVSGIEILNKAHLGNYAVGAFNINNLEMAQAIFEAADEMSSPIIIEASEGAIKYANINMIYQIVKTLSEQYPHIPVALHLDHGTSVDICVKAIKAGFTSVMIDASHHSFEDNKNITKQVCDIAHSVGVGVEAELGRLMGIEDDIIVSERDAILVNPKEAEEFVKYTNIDYLAPAIGTSHGAFKFKDKPKLDFDRLLEVKKRCNIPLVLHGASSIPDNIRERFEATGGELKGSKGVPAEFLKEAIKGGINKINTDTDLRIAFTSEVRRIANEYPSEFDVRKFFNPAKILVKDLVKDKIKLYKSFIV